MEDLDFKEIEEKWQQEWEKAKIFNVAEDTKKKKFYCLEMFPYPSALGLHVGHLKNYVPGDIIARFKRMQGYHVLYPMGYDSFGLPAENAAKKAGELPRSYTEKAIANYIKQQKMLGNSYDWSRKIATHQPEYYRWNQYFFLKFLEKGLAYKKKAAVNWCPKCESTLANEEVVGGRCWRHEDTSIEERKLDQWFLAITKYAEELLVDIDKLKWSEQIKALQKNWIGKSEGVFLEFYVKSMRKSIKVFTTRPDTAYGVTFLVVSPQHPLIWELLLKNKDGFNDFVKKVNAKDEEAKEKEGFFLGSHAINPFTNEEIPIFAANFVVAEYGTGAVMGVPAHDKRDFAFAKKYNIPIKQVIVPKEAAESEESEKSFQEIQEAYINEGVLINSGKFSGLYSPEAIEKIIKFSTNQGFGEEAIQYKIRDWLISRQRYWGTPIPVVYCKKCGTVPVPENQLPVLLPEDVKFGETGNPILTSKSFLITECPQCKGVAKRETDTMGGFMDSSWYFLRFCSPQESNQPFNKKEAEYWMPVDQYIGGIEHAVGHLMYARFFTKVLRDMKMLSFDEPFTRLLNQGILTKNGSKMSKSAGNVVDPLEITEKYGADALRMYMASVAHPESSMEWSDKGIASIPKVLKKISSITGGKFEKTNEKIEHYMHKTIMQVTADIEEFNFNLAIIKIIKYAEYLAEKGASKESYETLLKLIAPFCPHLAEEIWHGIGNDTFISLESWPKYNEKKIQEKFDQEEEQKEKILEDIKNVIKIIKQKNPEKEIKKVVLYTLPQELSLYNIEEEINALGYELKIYAVNDREKYDPQNKAGKAKQGKPAIYVE